MPNGRSGGFVIETADLKQLVTAVSDTAVVGKLTTGLQLRAASAADKVRLIFMTGDVAGTDAERFLEECGCRWIPKPFRLRDLVRVARETLG